MSITITFKTVKIYEKTFTDDQFTEIKKNCPDKIFFEEKLIGNFMDKDITFQDESIKYNHLSLDEIAAVIKANNQIFKSQYPELFERNK